MGTLYPDVIESVSFKGGPSQTIKSHHNVVAAQRCASPWSSRCASFFKDEVRQLGLVSAFRRPSSAAILSHGPGLAVRIREVTAERVGGRGRSRRDHR